jgi:hypothetical protein
MISRNPCRATTDEAERNARPFEVMTLAEVCADLILAGDVRQRFHQVEQFVESSFMRRPDSNSGH